MGSWRVILLALVGLLFAVPAARAQDAAVRVATCNPAKVFDGMEERKAVEDKMKADRDRAKAEADRRNMELKELAKQRDDLRPESAQYKEKNRQIMEKAVELEVWARITQQEMARAEKAEIGRLFENIRTATKEVAEAKKIDLVLAEHKPVIPENDQLTPDQFRAVISQINVLYSTPNVDITTAVITAVNRKYIAPAPAVAPAPAPAPAK